MCNVRHKRRKKCVSARALRIIFFNCLRKNKTHTLTLCSMGVVLALFFFNFYDSKLLPL